MRHGTVHLIVGPEGREEVAAGDTKGRVVTCLSFFKLATCTDRGYMAVHKEQVASEVFFLHCCKNKERFERGKADEGTPSALYHPDQ